MKGQSRRQQIGSQRLIRYAVINFAVIGLYWLLAHMAFKFFGQYSVLPISIWPSSAVALCAALNFGWKVAPAIYFATFFANKFSLGASMGAALGIGVMNTLGPILAAHMIRRQSRRLPPLHEIRDIMAFLVWGVLGFSVLSAIGGIGSLYAVGRVSLEGIPTALFRWSTANLGGVLIFYPIFAFLSEWQLKVLRQLRLDYSYFLLLACSIVCTAIVFFLIQSPTYSYMVIAFVLMGPIAWVAARFGYYPAHFVILCFVTVALSATLAGDWPIELSQDVSPLLLIWITSFSFVLLGLIVNAVVEELRSERERFRLMVEESPVAMALSDPVHNEYSLNAEFRRLFNCPENAFVNMVDVWDFLFQGNSPAAAKIKAAWCEWTSEAASNRSPGAFYFALPRFGLPDLNIRVLATAVRTRLVFSFVDVSQFVRAESFLTEAKAKAEQADRAKSEFLATMSHEIRTPMNAIIGMVDLLNQCRLEAKERQYVKILQNSSTVLLDLLNDVLELSKIESGTMELHPEVVSLAELINDPVELFKLRANEKGLSLSVQICGPLPKKIYADAPRIRQVLFNLLSNALKFTEKGSICVRLEVNSSRSTLVLHVQDTGIGISRQDQESIFERFRQVDSSSSRKYKGSGLGLAISRSLVQLMGGDIRVESHLGEGSDFMVELPLSTLATPPSSERELSASATDSAERPESIDPAKPLLGRRILVADDSEENLMLVQFILAPLCASITNAGNGEEAVLAYEHDQFDLVLMDVSMPILDGVEATQRIRTYERSHGLEPIPIIALTAHAMLEDSKRCRAAGYNFYLTKPFRRADLIRLVTSTMA